jgi:exodeoxyribonuclease VIII
VIVDLKTAESVAFEDFARSAARYQYHVQAAFYRHIESLATQSFSEKAFLHVVVESSPPYDCAFWELDEAALDAGKARWQKGLDLWAMCRHANRWPGVGWDWGESDYRIEKLSLPRWAL